MQPIKKRIDMYQVTVPAETTHRLGRSNASGSLGPVFCRKCGLMFDWKKDNKLDCNNCSEHRNKKGFRLIDTLK